MNTQPIVTIEGTLFYVDVLRDELRQKDNAANRISFSVFDQHGDGYTFLYDTATQSAADIDTGQPVMKETFKWVTLPALMELDPEGIARKYDIPLAILCPEKVIDIFNEEQEEYGQEDFYQ